MRDPPDEVHAADLIFARFLLTHLTDPLQTVEHWLGRLSPHGVVAVQEVESIATDEPTFETYLALQRRMLEANGHALDIGPVLAGAVWPSGTIRQNRVVRINPPVTAAARMFAMNFASWRTQPAVQQLASGQELDQIEEGLARLSKRSASDASIVWELREVVISGHSSEDDAASGRPSR